VQEVPDSNPGGPTKTPSALTTQDLHSLAIVFEVAEPARLPANRLHFVVEAFGDSVVIGMSPISLAVFESAMCTGILQMDQGLLPGENFLLVSKSHLRQNHDDVPQKVRSCEFVFVCSLAVM
jgi:hypothetical protein